MTRQAKYDYELLKREYIYDPSPGRGVSLTDLAERHGMPRSLLSDKAVKERWYEQRKEFRDQLGVKTVEQLTEKWVGVETATRERMMTTALKYLDKYEQALDAGEIKVSTRDMLGIAAMVRTLVMDAAGSRQPGEGGLIDPDATDLQPEDYRRALATIEQLSAGRLNGDAEPGLGDGPEDADEPPPSGAAGTRAN